MNDRPEITDQVLIKLAGESAFELGEDYFRKGAVGPLNIRGSRLRAEVKGSQNYQVTLVYNQQGLEGSCGCPASEGIDFCKHCVATAMVLREQLAEPVIKKGAKNMDILTAYLEKQDKAQLVKQFASLINGDKSLRQEWLVKAESDLGLLDKKTIRKRITAAIPYKRYYFKYAQVRQYFATIEQLFEQLHEPLRKLPASEQMELLDYAFERMARALETVDDSGGFRFDAISTMQSLYAEAFGNLDCPEEERAERLLKMLLHSDDLGSYGEVPGDYLDFISVECLELFHDKVRQCWSELPDLNEDDLDLKHRYRALLRVLAAKAEADNDVTELITLHRKMATGPYEFLQLARWSIDLKQYDEAQRYVNKAAKNSRFGSADAVHEVQQEILLAIGKPQEAVRKK